MILDLFKLDGRVAVVTGGRRGLGQSMAWGLAEAGADIVCVSKHGQADETRRLVEAAGRRFFDLQADLSEPEQRRGLIDKVVAQAGGIVFVLLCGGRVRTSDRVELHQHLLNLGRLWIDGQSALSQ